MEIRENFSLKKLTTMKVGGPARYFAEVLNIDELKEAIGFAHDKKLEILILGGGSNVLIADSGWDGIVINPKFLEFEINDELVKVGSGEIWDSVVSRCVEAGLWGIENMSFIPGLAGGVIVQNAGAYGQEIVNVIDSVDVYDTKENKELKLSKKECEFDYRRSIFNSTAKRRYIILGFTLKLNKNGSPNTSYSVQGDTLSGMREAIISIRKSKGQDINEFRSAGSFFKNPIISKEQYKGLDFDAPSFDMGDGMVKIPAGYILDKVLKLKGLSVGGAKLSEKQVINIINTENATADDVMQLFKKVRQLAKEKTGIEITNEPELIGFTEEGLKNYFELN